MPPAENLRIRFTDFLTRVIASTIPDALRYDALRVGLDLGLLEVEEATEPGGSWGFEDWGELTSEIEAAALSPLRRSLA